MIWRFGIFITSEQNEAIIGEGPWKGSSGLGRATSLTFSLFISSSTVALDLYLNNSFPNSCLHLYCNRFTGFNVSCGAFFPSYLRYWFQKVLAVISWRSVIDIPYKNLIHLKAKSKEVWRTEKTLVKNSKKPINWHLCSHDAIITTHLLCMTLFT